MAKAALNMMTRTCAVDSHADGIHINSVYTGWVIDNTPPPSPSAKLRDPIINGHNTGTHIWGQFLKD